LPYYKIFKVLLCINICEFSRMIFQITVRYSSYIYSINRVTDTRVH